MQLALIDAGDLVFNAHTQVLRFKRHIIHNFIVTRDGASALAPSANSESENSESRMWSWPASNSDS